jgi:hypothetical protein
MNKILIAALLFLVASLAQAGTARLDWVAPTVCADGSAVATNCPTTSYEIWMGSSLTGTFTKQTFQPAGTATSANLTSISPGTKCFFLKTVSGTAVSAESNRVCVDIPNSVPSPVTITITVTVTTTPASP